MCVCVCVCVCVFAGAGVCSDGGGQQLAWARFLFRIAYIVVMQLFFRLISQVSDAVLCAVITVCAIVYL